MYTDGEVFRISNGFDRPDGVDAVVLTKDELRKALIFFAPYFNGHVFGVVGDIWEDK